MCIGTHSNWRSDRTDGQSCRAVRFPPYFPGRKLLIRKGVSGGAEAARMGQIAVTLNGRTYRLRCGDGEEDRLVVLATQVKAKFDELLAQHGNAGEDRLLLMTALLLADELQDARSALEKGGDVARSGDGGKPSRKGAA